MSDHVFEVSTTSTQMPTLLVNRSVDDVLVKVKPNPHQAFTGHRCHESLLRTTPEISKFKAHDYSGPLR